MQLTLSSFKQEMTCFKIPAKVPIAVAVSGGADSLCLAYFLTKWAANRHPVFILTVNHGLRKEADKEVRLVASYAEKWGARFQELKWRGKKPTKALEEKAREARYQLMTDFCLDHHISYLFLAHHANDQIETVLARLAHGSGLTGLCGMAPCSVQRGLFLCRPFLSVLKKDLLKTAESLRLTWAEDSMNTDDSYERVRWRKAMPFLEELGLTAPHLLTSITRLHQANQALDQQTNDFISNFVRLDPLGYASFLKKDFAALPVEIQVRVLQKLIVFLGQDQTAWSLSTLEKKCVYPFKTFTLGSCVIVPFQQKIFIGKEKKYMPKDTPVLAGKPTLWDRFIITATQQGIISTQKVRHKKIPFLINQTIPVVTDKKGIEISFKIAYKKKDIFLKKRNENEEIKI